MWLHLLLFAATLVSTTAVGSRLAFNFDHSRPTYIEDLWAAITAIAHPSSLIDGLPFSLTLLTILLAHELGHLLLGVGGHARSGIMAGMWDSRALHQAARGELLFDELQRRRIEKNVALRY